MTVQDVRDHDPTALTAGTLVGGRYRVERALAQGGMGAVYAVADTRLSERRCALKVLRDAGLPPDERAEAAGWFAREAHLLSTLSHPLIPPISDSFSDGGHHYLVMAFVEGHTLEQVLADRGAPGLPVAEVRGWAHQLCAVLAYLHSRQPPVIFRDLKPANIMLTPQGTLQLIDFGIARVLEPRRTGQTIHTMIGTPGYSPPEQYQGLADARSDEYSLAATLHHLLSGRDPRLYPPFVFPPLSVSLPDVDPALDRAIAQALSLLAQDRFPSIHDFEEALSSSTGTTSSRSIARSSTQAASSPTPTRKIGVRPRGTPKRRPTRPLPPIPPIAPINPVRQTQPNVGRDVYVTSHKLDWPEVCACCLEPAETYFELEDPDEASLGAKGRKKRIWGVPLCSTCARHAEVYRRRRIPGWSILAAVVLLPGTLSIGDGLLTLVLAAVAGLAIVVKRTNAESMALALLRDTCCGPDYPVTYHHDGSIREFYFKNDAYAEMFAQANHKHLLK